MIMSTIEDRIVDVSKDADRRESYRMPKQGATEAKLKIGRKLLEVQVLDESAGGFLVSGLKIPDTSPTDTVELFHISGAHFLRVAWRRNIDGKTRLGLQRVCHAPPKQESPWLIWLVAAVVIGVGVGFVAATNNRPNIFDQLLNGGRVVNQSAATPTNQ